MSIGLEIGKEQNYFLKKMKNWIINQNINWDFLRQYDWLQNMQNCEQDPIWHAEGNVLKHTQMVVSELAQLADYQLLSDGEKEILLYAALLHDVAKPQTTVTEDGRIVSPKHAKIGEKVARDLLWDMDFFQREKICALVRLHGLPLWSLEKGNPNHAVISSSLRVENEWIYLLSKADVLGRICADQAILLEKLEFFKELCLENQCFTSEKVFFNNHSKFKYFQNDEKYPQHIFDDTKFEVTILSGIPGSGKDTRAAKIGLPIVSLDEIRQKLKIKPDDKNGQGKVIQEAFAQAKFLAAKKQSFVWNSTNLTQEMRSKLVNLLAPYNPTFKIIYIETSKKNVQKNRHADIPNAVLEKMYRNLEVPLSEEAHEVLFEKW
jgi:putative nucleotidyltransferase with HDIG domain